MAAKLFNPPPNWPAPPAGWQPEAGWKPDPEWGLLPAGWRLFARANPHPWRRSFATSGALWAVTVGMLIVGTDVDGEVAGRLLTTVCLFPGLVCALLARTSGKRWRWWRYLLTVIGLAFVFASLAVVAAAGSISAQLGGQLLRG